jgi:hypothetical protein
MFNLHLKECEFRFNNRKQNLYKILLEIFRKEPIKNEKYSIFELSKTDLNICSLALSHTTGIHFHNISKVQEIYSQVLGIKLQLDML